MSNVNTELANPSCLDLAGRWFLESGIQEPLGGVARYYRTDLSSNARVSTEITGYAASALAFLHSRTGDARYFEQALRAGRFLTHVAWNSLLRAFPFEVSPGANPTGGQAYFFDSGIIARGLVALWRVSQEAAFLETALACADSMATDFAAGLEFHPIVVLPSKEPAPRDQRWSRGPGCYQLKAALAWCELAEVTGRAGNSACYDRLLASALATHAAFLAGEAERLRVVDRLHAYCYFLEGLLPRATQPDCAAALREGLRRVADLLGANAPLFERSDVYAQLLRLRIFAAALGVVSLDRDAAEREVAAITGFQAADSDPRIDGGFRFGRQGTQALPYVNPASTTFCLQAVEMWRLYCAGAFQPDWKTLI